MSDRLGSIPFPIAQPDENPLSKYHKQLDPLAKLTDQMWQTPRVTPLAPIQPPMPQPQIIPPPNVGRQDTAMRQTGIATPTTQNPVTLSPTTPPEQALAMLSGRAPQAAPGGAPEAAPGGPPAGPQMRPGLGSAALAGAAGAAPRPLGGGAAALTGEAEGPGPGDVTQYRRSPRGTLTRGGRPQTGAAALGALVDTPSGLGGAGGGAGGGGGGEGGEGGGGPEGTPGNPWKTRSREEERINTALGAETRGQTPHAGSDKQVGLEMAKAAKPVRPGDPTFMEKSAQHFRNLFGDTIRFDKARNHEEVIETAIEHMKRNLLHVWNNVPDSWRQGAKLWYVGANKIAHDWANEFGYHPRQVAGALAALSPNMDWFQNVALARRVMQTIRDHQGTMTTDKMLARGAAFAKAKKLDRDRDRIMDGVNALKDKTFGQLTDNYHRALWMRLHDDVHQKDRSYRIVNPDGTFGDFRRNVPRNKAEQRDVSLRGLSTASFMGTHDIQKAMAILHDGSLENISRNTSDAHKVRSFYNNIIAPHSRSGDITSDTHAIAAAFMKPYSQSHDPVLYGLGSKGASHASGLNGLYPFIAEAYRRAAKHVSTRDNPVLAREMQSVVWEAIRGIFDKSSKDDPALHEAINGTWRRYAEGKASHPATMRQVYEHAGAPLNADTGEREPRPPEWLGHWNPQGA